MVLEDKAGGGITGLEIYKNCKDYEDYKDLYFYLKKIEVARHIINESLKIKYILKEQGPVTGSILLGKYLQQAHHAKKNPDTIGLLMAKQDFDDCLSLLINNYEIDFYGGLYYSEYQDEFDKHLDNRDGDSCEDGFSDEENFNDDNFI